MSQELSAPAASASSYTFSAPKPPCFYCMNGRCTKSDNTDFVHNLNMDQLKEFETYYAEIAAYVQQHAGIARRVSEVLDEEMRKQAGRPSSSPTSQRRGGFQPVSNGRSSPTSQRRGGFQPVSNGRSSPTSQRRGGFQPASNGRGFTE